MGYGWSWHAFVEPSPDGDGTYLGTLTAGLQVTLATTICAWLMALLLGTIIGIMRTVPNRWACRLANGYVEVFRNIPLLVQMFLWYFVLPEMVPAALGDWLKSMPDASFLTAVVALAFYTSAGVAVQVAAGIRAQPRGQEMAALALGLTRSQSYRFVLLPMAFRIIIPALANDCTSTVKNSSVALTIGLVELTARAKAMQEYSFHVFEAYAAATVGYVCVNLVVVSIMRLVEQRYAVPGFTVESPRRGAH